MNDAYIYTLLTLSLGFSTHYTVATLIWATLYIDFLKSIKHETLGGFTHDLCIYLDVDPETGLKRASSRGELDRFEVEKLEFFEKIRDQYLKLVNHDNKSAIINSNENIGSVKQQILEVFNKHIFIN